MPSKRIKKINEFLREELATILLRSVELDPKVMVTISRVETAADLKSARVWLSIIPPDKAQTSVKIISQNASAMQNELGKKITFKFTPKLHFLIDYSQDKAAKLNQLLDEIQKKS